MIICAVNVNVLLPCLCVLCALLSVGVAVMSALIAARNKYNAKMMKKDVYVRENVLLNGDCEENAENSDNDIVEKIQ